MYGVYDCIGLLLYSSEAQGTVHKVPGTVGSTVL